MAEILQFLAKAKDDYERLDQSESHLAKLEAQLAKEAEAVRHQAAVLLDLRHKADARFSKVMTETLNKLGMPNSRIAFHLAPMKEISPDGASGIELYFRPIRGKPCSPWQKLLPAVKSRVLPWP